MEQGFANCFSPFLALSLPHPNLPRRIKIPISTKPAFKIYLNASVLFFQAAKELTAGFVCVCVCVSVCVFKNSVL